MLTVPFATTCTLDIALRDLAGDPVAGAVVTLTISVWGGVDVIVDAAMTDLGAGNYTYTIESGLLALRSSHYRAAVTAQAGAHDAYAEIKLFTEVDAT